MASLLMLAPAPVIDAAEGLKLDVKFVEGMHKHVRMWNGPVSCVLWQGATSMPFGALYHKHDLPFELYILNAGQAVPADILRAKDVICASADAGPTLNCTELKAHGGRVVYTIEYTFRTRMDILRLEPSKSLLRRLRSGLWHVGQERRRRAAFRAADGLQANGYPAFAAYAGLNRIPMLYLDSRMKKAMLATEKHMAARASWLRSGKPLRLVHSGRLEPMKGAQDIVAIATGLMKAGVAYTLDVFGTGSLEDTIQGEIASAGLSDRVRLHKPVDFESDLVPWITENADLFLSCHRQGDPSCTYLESMGCGLPIVGYDNEMWRELSRLSGGGWSVPMGDVDAAVRRLASLTTEDILSGAAAALAFAEAHDFEHEFRLRMEHLAAMVA